MFSFWRNKEKVELKQPHPESVVGHKGICPSGEPIEDKTPLDQLLIPVKKDWRYGPTTGAE